jgi:DNA-binding SARP family transcriptional activator
MEFRVLGPFEVARDGMLLDLGGPHHRLLLALLLIHSGAVVSTDRLVDDLWEGRQPGTARHAVQSHVYRLRRVLGEDAWRLETAPPGYRLKVPTRD